MTDSRETKRKRPNPLTHPRGGISDRGTVLVAVVRRGKDFEHIFKNGWYRIPARQRFRRHPRYLAFYLTRKCVPGGGFISHYAPVKNVSRVLRRQLLPEEADHPRAEDRYWRFRIGRVRRLPYRIENRLRRRIIFAYTTLNRLRKAREVGELFDIPPLEEVMRKLLTDSGISFVSQFSVNDRGRCRYRLDFALLGPEGKIALECDHSKWHRRPSQRARDRSRDRWLRSRHWGVIHFTEEDILGHPDQVIREIKRMTLRRPSGYGGQAKSE